MSSYKGTHFANRKTDVPKWVKGSRDVSTKVALKTALEHAHKDFGNRREIDAPIVIPPIFTQVSVTKEKSEVHVIIGYVLYITIPTNLMSLP